MTLDLPPHDRPAWCVGVNRPPHVTEGVRPRKPHMVPMCDRCAPGTTQGRPMTANPNDPVMAAWLELLYATQLQAQAFAKVDRELRATGRYGDELHRILGQLRPTAANAANFVDGSGDGPDDALMDTNQLAARLNVSPRTARRLTNSAAIPSVKVGGQRRVHPDALHDYLDRNTHAR